MARIKGKLRNRMNTPLLDALMMIVMEGPDVEDEAAVTEIVNPEYGRLASYTHASQGRLSVIVVSVVSGEPSDPRPTPILRLKLLRKLSMGRATGPAAAPKGLGPNPLRTRHRPTHPTDSPDRDSGRHGAPNRTQGRGQVAY